MVRIKQLHYFMGLAKHRSYRAGARALEIAQSVLSQQIADLEAQLGVQLFIRGSHAVTLSPAGEALFTHLPDVFVLLYETAALAQAWSGQVEDQRMLRIGYERPLHPYSISHYLGKFKRSQDNVHCLIRQYSLEGLSQALHSGEIDAAFFLGPSSTLTHCAVQVIKTDPLALTLCRRLLPETMWADLPALLSSQPLYCLDTESSSTRVGFRLYCDLGLVPEYHICRSIDEIVRNVEAGTGLSLLPEECIRNLYTPQQAATLSLAGLSSSQVCWCVAHRPDNPNPLLRPFLALFPQAIPHCAGCAYQRECSVPLPQ